MKRRSFLKSSIATGAILSVNACQTPKKNEKNIEKRKDEFLLNEKSISDLQQAFVDGSLTSVEVIKLYMDRIESIDKQSPGLNSIIEMNPDAPIKRYESALRNPDFNVFYNAPCLVLIVGSKQIRSLDVDCALAACYFMFAASHRGLGTCWIGLGTNVRDPELFKLIGLPEDYRIVAPLILGYPKRIPNPPKRLEPQILNIVS